MKQTSNITRTMADNQEQHATAVRAFKSHLLAFLDKQAPCADAMCPVCVEVRELIEEVNTHVR